ncbi:MAG: hypothetical protein PHZ23_14720 [Acidiphilium sp.]|nr:hypothetical protein [Acidiphilium sp.]
MFQSLELALASVFQTTPENRNHHDYSRIDETCPCDICTTWRRSREVYSDVQQPIAYHPDDCHCIGCDAARRARSIFLAADNRRTLFCEIGFHVQDNPEARRILQWVRSEFVAENRSDSWWASRGENYSIAYWLQRYQRQPLIRSNQIVTPPKNRKSTMAEDWKRLWYAEYQSRRAQHETDRQVKMEQIAALQAQLDEAMNALEEHDKAASLMALHYAIPLVSGGSGYLYSDKPVSPTPLFQVCIAVVRDAGPNGLTSQQILDKVTVKGYASTLASISTIMLRISKSGAVGKDKDTGKWFIVPPEDHQTEDTEAEIAPDDSDIPAIKPPAGPTITEMVIEALNNTPESSLSRDDLERAVSDLGGNPASVGFRLALGRMKANGKIHETEIGFALGRAP